LQQGSQQSLGQSLRQGSRQSSGAFSLIEILITVGLLSFIILGLLAMFNQTQKAFTGSMHDTDLLESGRIVMDMMARDFEQMQPACPPFYSGAITTNFFAEDSPRFANPQFPNSLPWTQGLPGTGVVGGAQTQRNNFVQDIFFVSKVNQNWFGTGYAVLPDYQNAGIGTLYRFNYPVAKFDDSNNLSYASTWFRAAAQYGFQNYAQTNLTVTNMINTGPFPHTTSSGQVVGGPNTYGMGNAARIADGVVHFRVRTFASGGFPIVDYDPNVGNFYPFSPNNTTNAFFRTNAFSPFYSTARQVWLLMPNSPLRAYRLPANFPENVYFYSNSVPAYVELEFGILEPQIYQRYKAIGNYNPQGQQNYLSNHVAQVHLFRQRIPIRGVDPTAYQ
jgi:hypothetical protein